MHVSGSDFDAEFGHLYDDGDMWLGLTDFIRSRVYLRTDIGGLDLSPRKLREILAHEVTHLLEGHTGAAFADEEACRLFASAWLEMLRRNPVLVDYLLEDA